MRQAAGSAGRDEKWFVALYERAYEDVLRYARRRVGENAAREVAAETFLVAWRRLEAIPAEPLPWLYGVARRVLANEARRLRRQDRTAARIAASLPVFARDETALVGEKEIVGAALAVLSGGDREVISLVAWEGLDTRAAAQVVGCSPGTFAVRLHRARQKLRRALEDQQEGRPARECFSIRAGRTSGQEGDP